MGKTQTKTKQNLLKNSLEIAHSYSTDTVKNIAKGTVNEASQLADGFFAEFLGVGHSSESSHENKNQNGEVEVYSAQTKKTEKAPWQEAHGHIDYHGDIVKSSEKASRSELHALDKQITEIIAELQNLISTSKVLQMEFAEIAVEQTPTSVGEYHLNFFEWMLLTIRQAREKVEDSGAWLGAVKGKSGKKDKGYWNMFKKHGTSFGMSNERSAATSTG